MLTPRADSANMEYISTRDTRFLRTVESWLHERSEVLALIRFSRAAGSKSFEFFSLLIDLTRRERELSPSTNIIIFRALQLPLRGVIDDSFIEKCISSIPENSEFLVVETAPRTAGKTSWFHHSTGESHGELRTELQDLRGRPVAAGEYPPWQEDSSNVISGIVPDQEGNLKLGIY